MQAESVCVAALERLVVVATNEPKPRNVGCVVCNTFRMTRWARAGLLPLPGVQVLKRRHPRRRAVEQ
jgi:hypothetical protein